MELFDENDISKLQSHRDKLSVRRQTDQERAEHNTTVFLDLIEYTEGLLKSFAEQASELAEPEQRPRWILGIPIAFGTVNVFPVVAPKNIGHGIIEEDHVWAWVTNDGRGFGRYEKEGREHHYYPITYNFGYRASVRRDMIVCPLRVVAEYITKETVDLESEKKLPLEKSKKKIKNIFMTGLKNL